MSAARGQPGDRSDRLSSDAMQSGVREVFPVEAKRRRVEEEEQVLETEDTIDPEAMREFEKRMADHNVDKEGGAWKLLFDEFVVDRLKEKSPMGWAREMRRRNIEVGPINREEEDQADEDEVDRGDVEGGEDVGTEGRRVRYPTVPYVPTAKERREHSITHYPHRTWCECCMAGRAISGAHRKSKDEANPLAGEFHFDYCFLKMRSKMRRL